MPKAKKAEKSRKKRGARDAGDGALIQAYEAPASEYAGMNGDASEPAEQVQVTPKVLRRIEKTADRVRKLAVRLEEVTRELEEVLRRR